MPGIFDGEHGFGIEPDDDANCPFVRRGDFRGVLARTIRLVVTQLNYVVIWIVDIE